MIDLLEKPGVNLAEPYSKHIEGSLWELKPQRNRILYFLNRRTFILLHGFKKTSKKLPVSEKKLPFKEWKNISKGGKNYD
jgi:phage-related protein